MLNIYGQNQTYIIKYEFDQRNTGDLKRRNEPINIKIDLIGQNQPIKVKIDLYGQIKLIELKIDLISQNPSDKDKHYIFNVYLYGITPAIKVYFNQNLQFLTFKVNFYLNGLILTYKVNLLHSLN